jgi:hypothetical protein
MGCDQDLRFRCEGLSISQFQAALGLRARGQPEAAVTGGAEDAVPANLPDPTPRLRLR